MPLSEGHIIPKLQIYFLELYHWELRNLYICKTLYVFNKLRFLEKDNFGKNIYSFEYRRSIKKSNFYYFYFYL